MAADTDAGLVADILKFLGGALLTVLGLTKWLYNIKRTAEDANGKADVNAERMEHAERDIVDLRLASARSEEKYDALIEGHKRIEHKIDRLAEGLGG